MGKELEITCRVPTSAQNKTVSLVLYKHMLLFNSVSSQQP